MVLYYIVNYGGFIVISTISVGFSLWKRKKKKSLVRSSRVTVSHVQFLDTIRARSGRNCVQSPTCLLVHRQHGTAELQHKQTLAPSPHLVTLSFRIALPPLQRQPNFKNNPPPSYERYLTLYIN